MKYLFGPVNSRRLGKSLGIDLMPYKTCTLDCVYCECGKTTNLTNTIAEYVPTDDVLREIDEFLSTAPELDVVTFSGSGEPTLHANIGKIISHIKEKYPRYKIAVLTNGTLLWHENVRHALLNANIVIPSLDAATFDVFSKILRNASDVTVEHLVEGLTAFAKEYRGRLYIEVFIVEGINDTAEELQKIKNICLDVKPSAVQLNTLDRPGTESWVNPLDEERLLEIKEFFAPLDVSLSLRPGLPYLSAAYNADMKEAITSTLMRRPSTAEELALQMGFRLNEVQKILAVMIGAGTVKIEKMERGEFFSLN